MNLPICDSIIVDACHGNCKVPKKSRKITDRGSTLGGTLPLRYRVQRLAEMPQLHAINYWTISGQLITIGCRQ